MSKLHHFLVPNLEFKQGEKITLDTEIVHQIKDVLKLKIGEEIVLGNGVNLAGRAQILDFKNKQILLEVSQILDLPKPDRHASVYCALLKKNNLEWLIAKAVEAGADEIIPLITKRVVKTDFNRVRLEKIIKESAEQSERLFLPKLFPPKKLLDALETAAGEKIFFDKNGVAPTGYKTTARQFSVFIGPEGGWDEYELELAKKSGARVVSLGENILRAETAAAVAVYLAKNIF